MVSFKKILLVCTILFLPLTGFSQKKFCRLEIINKNNKRVILYAKLANTYTERARGLMFRKKLGYNKGMLFVFEKEQKLAFWMKNTYLPLSIAYISKNGIINEIYNMKPLDTSVTYPSSKPALYALEVNKGWFKKHNITQSCRIILDGCISKQD